MIDNKLQVGDIIKCKSTEAEIALILVVGIFEDSLIVIRFKKKEPYTFGRYCSFVTKSQWEKIGWVVL